MRWHRALVSLGALTGLVQAVERGPDPTKEALEQEGPFAIRAIPISDAETPGFGAATIFIPEDTSGGLFPGVSMSPGYTSTQTRMEWFARRVASHGFAVINTDTNDRFDLPSSRGVQTLAALDFLVSDSSPVADLINGSHLGAMGFSMGGGGSLEAALNDGSLGAVVAVAPFHGVKDFGQVSVPTFVLGIEGDTIAPVETHSKKFFESLSGSKAYAELDGGTHETVVLPNAALSRYAVSWLKLNLEKDARYFNFACTDIGDTALEEFRGVCDNLSSPDDLDLGSSTAAIVGGVVAAGFVLGVAFLASRQLKKKDTPEPEVAGEATPV